jgi:DNA-binding CsgD family transcriptional regulator
MRTTAASQTDVDALLRVVASLAEFRDLESLRRHTVAMLPTLVSANAVAWNEVDLVGNRIDAVMEPDLYDRVEAANFMTNIDDHPVISLFNATGDGRPYAISDFLSADEFHATGLYRKFYRLLGAEDQISFILPDPHLIIGIALNRERRGFAASERWALNALRPHLVQAHRNATDFSRLQRSVSAMQAMVEASGEGLLMLDPARCRVEHSTPLGTALLQRWFGTDRLPEAIIAWLRDSTVSAAPAKPLILGRDGMLLTVRRVPTQEAEALLIAERPAERVDALLRRLGLTAREAEVLVLVTTGVTVAQIGSRLKISPRTVEKHVEHVYDKLGLENRVGATNFVRQLERRPPGLTAEKVQ